MTRLVDAPTILYLHKASESGNDARRNKQIWSAEALSETRIAVYFAVE